MATDFAAGCLGGAAGVLVGHPFDTIKVHLQTQDPKKPVYRGTIHCFKTIIARDSLRGLYRGLTSPIAGVSVVNAIIFGVYGNVQRNFADPNSLKSQCFAGIAAGTAQVVVCSPMELAKTRLQLQSNSGGAGGGIKFSGPLQCLGHIWKTEGYRGIFRGITMTTARDVPGFSSYFVMYELLMRNIQNPGAFHTLMAGGCAGVFSWIVSAPMDVIKSRLQVDSTKYKGIKDCIVRSYREEGWAFLTRGISSTLMRAFVINAVCFYVVTYTLKLFDNSTIDVKLPKQETLTVVVPPQSTKPHMITPIYSDPDRTHHRVETMKSLIYCTAMSDALFRSDIVELANDLYDDRRYTEQQQYFNYNIDNISDLPSIQLESDSNDICDSRKKILLSD